MIRVRILLRGGHIYETSCADQDPLLGDLSRLVAGAGSSGALQIEINQHGTRRGVAIPFAQVVAVETDPPVPLVKTAFAGIQPCPYIRIPDFLTAAENAAIMDYAIRKQSSFVKSGVDGPMKDHRSSQVLMQLDDIDVDLAARVKDLLPEVAACFGMTIPAGYGFEMQLTTHGDGGYFRIHNDNGTPATASRFLTYVYYFCREPREFSGGQIRLYDQSQVDPTNWVPAATFSEIEPHNNMLLFFPSRHYHEVLPTLSRTNEFAGGRFTLNGWIRTPAVTSERQ